MENYQKIKSLIQTQIKENCELAYQLALAVKLTNDEIRQMVKELMKEQRVTVDENVIHCFLNHIQFCIRCNTKRYEVLGSKENGYNCLININNTNLIRTGEKWSVELIGLQPTIDTVMDKFLSMFRAFTLIEGKLTLEHCPKVTSRLENNFEKLEFFEIQFYNKVIKSINRFKNTWDCNDDLEYIFDKEDTYDSEVQEWCHNRYGADFAHQVSNIRSRMLRGERLEHYLNKNYFSDAEGVINKRNIETFHKVMCSLLDTLMFDDAYDFFHYFCHNL